MAVLVTGAAGFIGYHVCSELLARGETVVGVDMGQDHQVQAAVPGRQRVGKSHRGAIRVRPSVNQHLPTAGGNDQDAVSLSHIEKVDVQFAVGPGRENLDPQNDTRHDRYDGHDQTARS